MDLCAHTHKHVQRCVCVLQLEQPDFEHLSTHHLRQEVSES